MFSLTVFLGYSGAWEHGPALAVYHVAGKGVLLRTPPLFPGSACESDNLEHDMVVHPYYALHMCPG